MKNSKLKIDQLLKECIEKYTNFLKKANSYADVIVISTPLPTIQDGVYTSDVANKRKEVKASLKERTKLTLKFNNLLNTFCQNNKIKYINLDDEVLDKDNNLKDFIFSKDISDHHYDKKAYSELIIKYLKVLKIRNIFLPIAHKIFIQCFELQNFLILRQAYNFPYFIICILFI